MQQGSQTRSALRTQEEVTVGIGKVSPHLTSPHLVGSNTIYSGHNLSQHGEDSEPKNSQGCGLPLLPLLFPQCKAEVLGLFSCCKPSN